ncbi:MAG: YdcF family protein [Leptolyngbyaceae bacterium]|nr:YdcF family protein [Leptolyngbyaceae bacterium]
MLNRKFKKIRWLCLASFGFIALLISAIPIRLGIARLQAPYPQAILVLGGDPRREEVAAELAALDPAFKVWVSTGMPYKQSQQIFQAAGVPAHQVTLNYHAVDTLTNFTTLIADFQEQRIQHLYMVTSDYHLPRSKMIAYVVLGSRGITFTPVSVSSVRPGEYPRLETRFLILRDTTRAILWLFTGYTGNPTCNSEIDCRY